MVAGLLGLLPWLSGCPAISRYRARGEVLERKAPLAGGSYLLYVPSGYVASRPWPLVVTCHGTGPWDSARLQTREWAGLAEHSGFLVLAPKLRGTRGDITPSPAEQIRLQRADEQAILAAVNHVKAGYNIAEGKVFLTGWSAGAFAVLWTGLGHPEVFRALAIRQGNFNAAFLKPLEDRLDRHQPVFVFYGQVDPLRSQSQACIRWLRERGMRVFADEVPGAHRRMPEIAWRFFTRVMRNFPWFVVQCEPGWSGEPRTVRFWVKADPPPKSVRWSFGDGGGGSGPTTVHRYEAGGTYQVAVRAVLGKGRQVTRRLRVTVAPASSAE